MCLQKGTDQKEDIRLTKTPTRKAASKLVFNSMCNSNSSSQVLGKSRARKRWAKKAMTALPQHSFEKVRREQATENLGLPQAWLIMP